VFPDSITGAAMISGITLPRPEDGEKENSELLAGVIREEIKGSGGLIPFSRFMDLALYSVPFGYYESGSRKFGEQGDFITAPELGDLFAKCLASQVVQILDKLSDGNILEVGAGSGILAAQLLEALAKSDKLPPSYGILEVSASLAQRQRETLQARVPQYVDRVQWLAELPQNFNGVILANEVVDALPVERFHICNGQVQGLGGGWENGGFVDKSYAVDDPGWDAIRDFGLAENYRSEVGFHGQAWMRTLAGCMESGLLLVVDYGYPAPEYYHPQRAEGTLRCHFRHRAHANPYTHVGLQDITAHVDFTALARCAHDSGLSLLGFSNQASFLLSLGILDVIESDMQATGAASMLLGQQVKRLTLPSDMGELFKVLAVGTGIEGPLAGFALTNHRNRL
jgi:SAM-dependent MidA family methyltransferase